MRIWHESLIPKLCQKHLCAMWREALGCYEILVKDKKGYRNHPATKEFEDHWVELVERLRLVRKEMISRGYNPKEFNTPDYVPNPGYTPWQTLEEQIEVLKLKNCECNV